MKLLYRYFLRYGIAALLTLIVFILSTNWGLTLVFKLATKSLGEKMTVTALDGTILGPISMQELRYHDADIDLTIKNAQVDWNVWMLFLNKINITSLNAQNINLRILSTTHTDLPVAPLGNYQYIVKKSNIESFEYFASPSSQPLRLDKLVLSGDFSPQQLTIKHLSAKLHGIELATVGRMAFSVNYPLHFDVTWKYESPTHAVLTGNGKIDGDLQLLNIQQQLADSLEGELTGQISHLTTQPHWQAQLDLRKLLVRSWIKRAPNIAVIGTLHGVGDFSDMTVKGNLHGTHDKLGILESVVDLRTQDAFINYQFNFDNTWRAKSHAAAFLQLEGTGTHDGVKFSRITGKTAEGIVRANADVQWLPMLSASANLSMQNVDTSLFWPQWPGLVGAQLHVSTKQIKAKTNIQLQLTALNGQLRGYPLKGNALLNWYNNQIEIPSCDLQMGASQLTLSGQLNQHWKMQAKLESADVNSLLPSASGALTLRGEITGARSMPRIQGQWRGRNLHYRDFAAQKVEGAIDASLLANSLLQFTVKANNASYRDLEWNDISIGIDGTTAEHRLNWHFAGDDSSSHGLLHGSYQADRWQGIIDEVDVKYAPIGRWVLQQPTPASFSSHEQKLQHFCLQHDQSHLCADIDWGSQQHNTTINGTSIPLDLVDIWLPDNLSIGGQLNLSAQFTQQEQSETVGHLTIQSAANSIGLEFLDLDETIRFGAVQLDVDMNQNGLESELKVPLQDGGGMQGRLRLTNWKITNPLDREQSLTGKLRVEHIPMATLTRFIPNLGRVEGQLEADMSFEGTLGHPQLSGAVKWEQGKAVLPALGITLQDVAVHLQSAHDNTIQFQLQARSGEGELRLQGQTHLDASAGWPTEAKLTGNNAEILNVSEAWILVNPDIVVTVNGNQIILKGEVDIPRARLQPRSLPEGSVALSDDVIILEKDHQPEKSERWKLSTQIRVRFGDLVDFDGFGLSGKLTGNLLVIDEPGKFTVGQGEVGITDGIYRMRGQNLNVTRGRLLYANNLLAEPGIDVEASRVVGDVTAGVRVRGTLQKPELKIFSTPAMSDSDALSYLILGHPLNQASTTEGESVRNAATAVSILSGDLIAREIGGRLGLDELRVEAGQTAEQTSLVAGKYLSPKLYVRYFSGLVESSNIVQLRYQLSKRLQIQTEGGYRGAQSVTGGDLIFTLEY